VTATPTSTASATPAAERIEGDVDCDGQVSNADLEFVLEFSVGLNDGATPGSCPDLGSTTIGAVARPWGDTNCDDHVDAIDALYIVAYEASIQLQDPAGCPPVGSASS